MAVVVFFDPYPVVAVGFTQILRADRPELRSLAITSHDGLAALAPELTPDLLIVTINSVKNRNPLQILGNCKKIFPHTPIVLYDEGHYKSRMEKWLRAGAVGYLFKSEAESELLQCIDKVLSGRKYLSPEGWRMYFLPKRPVKQRSTVSFVKKKLEVA